MIQSVYIGDDAELVPLILDLHHAGPLVLDATWGHGGFWRTTNPDAPNSRELVALDRRMATDEISPAGSANRRPRGQRAPSAPSFIAGDFTRLPFRSGTFNAIVFDPPFLTRGGDQALMKRRYGSFDTYEDLMAAITRARDEFHRVLRIDGVIVFKIQDFTEGRIRKWSHIDAANIWTKVFRLDDLIVKVATTNLRTTAIRQQQRSKSAHTFFMVFRQIRPRGRPAKTPVVLERFPATESSSEQLPLGVAQ